MASNSERTSSGEHVGQADMSSGEGQKQASESSPLKDAKTTGTSSSAGRGSQPKPPVVTEYPGATGRWEIVQVEERHGPMHNAIPCLPMPLSVIFCLFNFLVPGIGTLFAAPFVFCPGVTTRLGDNRLRAFGLNIVSAFLQIALFIIIVGWIWSILWGMTFITLSLNRRPKKPAPQQNLRQMRRQSSVEATLVQRV